MWQVMVAAGLAMTPVASTAAVVVYGSYAAITAAGVVPRTTFVAPSPFDYGDNDVFDVPSPFAVGPVRFSGSTYLALYDDYATYIGGSATLTLATPPVAAVGLYYGSYYGEVATVTVDGVTVIPALPVPAQQIGFIGFTSDRLITSIVFTGGETDVARGFLSAVPEPATWLELTAGVGIVGIAGRRRRGRGRRYHRPRRRGHAGRDRRVADRYSVERSPGAPAATSENRQTAATARGISGPWTRSTPPPAMPRLSPAMHAPTGTSSPASRRPASSAARCARRGRRSRRM